MKYLLEKLTAMRLMLVLFTTVIITSGCATASDKVHSRIRVTVGNPNIQVTWGYGHDGCNRHERITYNRKGDYIIEKRVIVSDDHKYCHKRDVIVKHRHEPLYYRCDKDDMQVQVIRKRPARHTEVINTHRHQHEDRSHKNDNREHRNHRRH